MEAALWPYGKCKKCANKNYCAWSESEILNCMNNGYPNFSPMRNADRIRAMTDEELAEFCGNDVDACPPRRDSGKCIDELYAHGEEPYPSVKQCMECWLGWLKQETE